MILDPDYYALKLPVIEEFGTSGNLLRVADSSRREWKEALECLAWYFKREMHYDFVAYEALESPRSGGVPFVGYLFTEVARDLLEEDGPPLYRTYGGCGFRERRVDDLDVWVLDWIWFHPYFRGQGRLERHWATFESERPNFRLQTPLSLAMRQFLKKNVGADWETRQIL